MFSNLIFDLFLLIKDLTPSFFLASILELPMFWLYTLLQAFGL